MDTPKSDGLGRSDAALKQRARLLIVDDDPHVREGLRDILEYAGYAAHEAGDGKTALDVLVRQRFDLIFLDLELPRIPGMEVLRRARVEHPGVPVVIVSGKGTISTAVEATRLGAYDFLEKPVDVQRTLLTVRNALQTALLERQRDRLLEEARARYRMVGSSPPMQKIYQLIDRAAAAKSKVLITGESGTGKEMVARAIHHNSPRAPGPFVTVNCAAIPETLIESELFGHEKGSFTGATQQRAGKFEQAHEGTLFLDEIGDMTLMTQAKTLRVLAEKCIERIGGSASIPIDVRIITATNKDLHGEIGEGNFREDLFYRLNVITIEVPPLRERREDIPSLVDHFLKRYCRENDVPLKQLDPAARAMLVEYDWPGNVRQLRNAVERLVVLSDGETITAREVAGALNRPGFPTHDAAALNLREARDQFECDYISQTLIVHDWKIQETAAALGIDRSHLWKKMQRYGIESPS